MSDFLSLSASAGSGKTFGLAVRFVGLLFLGANINEILTLTFTNKAANEMKERISFFLESLKNFALFNEADSNTKNIINELKNFGVSEESILQNAAKIYEKFLMSNPQISTLDSFISKILRRFCWYVGVSLNPKLIDNLDLADNFVDKMSEKQLKDLAYFLEANESKLKDFIEFLDLLFYAQNLLNFHGNPAHKKELESLIKKSANEFCDTIERAKSKTDSIKYENNLNSFLARLKAAEPTNILTESLLDKKSDGQYLKQFQQNYGAEIDAYIDNLSDLISQHFNEREKIMLEKIKAFLDLYNAAKNERILKKNEISFAYKTQKVYELLAKNFEREFFYFRLDDKYTHMLLDEFQDTSPEQYEILLPMIKEILSGAGQKISERSFFVVGDTKQAIYGFRGGDERVFEALNKIQNIKKQSMKYNFRSTKIVLDFVNSTFEKIIPNYENQQILNLDAKQTGGFVEVKNIFNDGLNKDEAAPLICEAVLESVNKFLSHKIAPSDIAVISFQNDDLREIAEFLKAHKIPISLAQSEGLSAKKETKIILESIKIAQGNLDKKELNFSSACIKKLLGLHLDSVLDLSFLSALKFATPLSFVKKCADNFGLKDSIIANILEFALDFDNLDEFAENLASNNQKIEQSFGDGVRLLTIHKSKGLEFKHLIIADKFGKDRNDRDPIIFDFDGIKIHRIFYKMKERERYDFSFAKVLEKQKHMKQKEALNVLYVALTRAQKSLVIIQKSQKSKFEILNLAPQKIGEILESSADSKNILTTDSPKIVSALNLKHTPQDFAKKAEQKDDSQSKNISAIYFGNALHFILQAKFIYPNLSLESRINLAKNKFGFYLESSAFARLKNIAAEVENDTEYKNLLENKEKFIEKSYIDIRKDVLLGRFDMLLCSQNELIVLDFKSSKNAHKEHVEQVEKYVDFLKAAHPEKSISGYLVYCQEAQKLFKVG